MKGLATRTIDLQESRLFLFARSEIQAPEWMPSLERKELFRWRFHHNYRGGQYFYIPIQEGGRNHLLPLYFFKHFFQLNLYFQKYTTSRMYGDVPENVKEKSGSVSNDLSPRRNTKTMRAMKAPYSVK